MAEKFRFRLEVVRRVRKQAQDRQRRVVADAVRAVKVVEDRIERLTEDLHRTFDRSRDVRQSRRLNLASLRSHQVYRGCVHRWLIESASALARRKAELDHERSKLAEATKKLKAIEKLRERKWATYAITRERKEQAEFDESAMSLFMRGPNAYRSGGVAS